MADQTATTSGASPAKVSKVSKAKEIPNKGQKATPKLVDNQSATKHALLADQTAKISGASPPKVSKVSKAKEIPNKGQKAAPKLVDNQSATKHATCPEIIFKTSCGIFTSAIQMRPTHKREKQTMILCFWLGQWWT